MAIILSLSKDGGDERAFELLGQGELIDEVGDGGDLVGLVGTLSWASVSRALVAYAPALAGLHPLLR